MISGKLPVEVKVKGIKSSRYKGANRPDSWDLRVAGVDEVLIDSGETIKLLSESMQSPPEEGWRIVLTSGVPDSGYKWTFFGV